MTTVNKVEVAGEIEVAVEGGFEDKGYTFYGEDQPYALRYSRSEFGYATLPPIDLAFRIGATGPIAGKWRWQATVGPYLNFASYKSDAEVSSQQAAEQDKNTLGAIEYGASLKLQGSTEILSGFIRGGIDVGPFFEARLGGVGFYNPTGQDASYIGAYQAHDWGTDPGSNANPMVGEIGLGAVFGPLNVGIFADTGLNTDFANLGEPFDHYTKNDDGTWNETATTRTSSYTSGSNNAASSISQFGTDTGINKYSWSVKVGVDLVALGRMIVTTTAPKRAEKQAADKLTKEAEEKKTAEAEAKAAAAAKEKADADAKAKEEADAKKKAEADAARTQTIKIEVKSGD